MYCRTCGNEVAEQAIMCVACGTPPKAGKSFCFNCKAETSPDATICLKCGVALQNHSAAKQAITGDRPDSKRITAAILAIFLGGFGVHKFYLGYNGAGIIQLLLALIIAPAITLFSCGLGLPLAIFMVATVPFIEGIIYLTRSDEQFVDTYQIGKKQWL